MMLDAELLKVLRCPNRECKGELELRGPEGPFVCPACQLSYAVTDGVPNFIIEDAEKLGSS